MSKHRRAPFRPGYAAFRIDDYDLPALSNDQNITVKEGLSSQEQADTEAARLKAIDAHKSLPLLHIYANVEHEA